MPLEMLTIKLVIAGSPAKRGVAFFYELDCFSASWRIGTSEAENGTVNFVLFRVSDFYIIIYNSGGGVVLVLDYHLESTGCNSPHLHEKRYPQ